MPARLSLSRRLASHLFWLTLPGLLLAWTVAAQVAGWVATYGGGGNDQVAALAPLPEGGLVAVGATTSLGAGERDAWIFRLDDAGNVVWEKTFGGREDDAFAAVAVTPDGEIVATGHTFSFGRVGQDLWAIRLNAQGDVVWQKTYDASGNNAALAVATTGDGDLFLAGKRLAVGGNEVDGWVLRLDGAGNLLWQKTLGGPALDQFWALAVTADGGVVAAGESWSFGDGAGDAWLISLDPSGAVRWQATYGVDGTPDVARAVLAFPSGDLLVAGATGAPGQEDAWVMRLNDAGGVTWQMAYGGPGEDRVNVLVPINGGEIVLAGYSDSVGDGDAWALRLGAGGAIVWQRAFGMPEARDEIAGAFPGSDDSLTMGGETHVLGVGVDALIFRLDATGKLADGSLVTTESAATASTRTVTARPSAATIAEPDTQARDIQAAIPSRVEASPTPIVPQPRPGVPQPQPMPEPAGTLWQPFASLGLALALLAGTLIRLRNRR